MRRQACANSGSGLSWLSAYSGGAPSDWRGIGLLGADDSKFDVFAAILNDLTVFPACILAFWHRRTACIWLTANGVTLVTAATTFTQRTHEYRPSSIVGVGVVVLITVLLDLMEVLRWPGALDRPLPHS